MEALLRDLMQQRGATQPKLLLRRTESIVEKLLTNWMSICLYGFLRVQPTTPNARYQLGQCFSSNYSNAGYWTICLFACFALCTGNRGAALVPDSERSDAADGEGAGGLRD